MTEVRLSYVTITYEKPIVFFDYKKGTELGFPEIKELIHYAEELTGHKPYVTLSVIANDMRITEEGKKYVEDLSHMPLFRGTAAVVKNSMYQFGVNFLNSFFGKKKYPFRAFTSKQKAIDWLLSLPL